MAQTPKSEPKTEPKMETKTDTKTAPPRARAAFPVADPVLLDGIAYAAGDTVTLTAAQHAEMFAAGVVAIAFDDGADPQPSAA